MWVNWYAVPALPIFNVAADGFFPFIQLENMMAHFLKRLFIFDFRCRRISIIAVVRMSHVSEKSIEWNNSASRLFRLPR